MRGETVISRVNCHWPFENVRPYGLLRDGIGVNEAGQTYRSPGVFITRLPRRREVRQIFDPSLRCTSVQFRRLDPLWISDAEGSNSRACDSGVRPDRTSPTISRRSSGAYRCCFRAIVNSSFLPLFWKCPRKRANSATPREATDFRGESKGDGLESVVEKADTGILGAGTGDGEGIGLVDGTETVGFSHRRVDLSAGDGPPDFRGTYDGLNRPVFESIPSNRQRFRSDCDATARKRRV